jgi:hypothetical protein
VEPIEFQEQTVVWAKNQPPYLPLPAYTDERETISCWRLTWRERLRVFLRGRLWLRQMNFGQPLQPQAPSIESPFVAPGRQAKIPPQKGR